MNGETKPMTGWKVKSGTLIVIIGTAIFSTSEIVTDPAISVWIALTGKMLLGIGGGLVSWGMGHKLEKNKEEIRSAIMKDKYSNKNKKSKS